MKRLYKMLPLEIKAIILDYHYGMIRHEKLIRLHLELFTYGLIPRPLWIRSVKFYIGRRPSFY